MSNTTKTLHLALFIITLNRLVTLQIFGILATGLVSSAPAIFTTLQYLLNKAKFGLFTSVQCLQGNVKLKYEKENTHFCTRWDQTKYKGNNLLNFYFSTFYKADMAKNLWIITTLFSSFDVLTM